MDRSEPKRALYPPAMRGLIIGGLSGGVTRLMVAEVSTGLGWMFLYPEIAAMGSEHSEERSQRGPFAAGPRDRSADARGSRGLARCSDGDARSPSPALRRHRNKSRSAAGKR